MDINSSWLWSISSKCSLISFLSRGHLNTFLFLSILLGKLQSNYLHKMQSIQNHVILTAGRQISLSGLPVFHWSLGNCQGWHHISEKTEGRKIPFKGSNKNWYRCILIPWCLGRFQGTNRVFQWSVNFETMLTSAIHEPILKSLNFVGAMICWFWIIHIKFLTCYKILTDFVILRALSEIWSLKAKNMPLLPA